MITLFEDINNNEKSMVRDKKESNKAVNNNRHENERRRIISRIARILHLEKSVNSKEEATDAQDDLGMEQANEPGMSKQQSYALAEMNG